VRGGGEVPSRTAARATRAVTPAAGPGEAPPAAARGRVRRMFALVSWFALMSGGVLVLLGLRPDLQMLSVIAALYAALTPYGVGAWLVAAAVCAAVGRRRILTLVALGGLLLQLSWTAPYWPGEELSPGALTVMTLNLRCVPSDPGPVHAAIEAAHADVVVLADVTESTFASLEPMMSEALPHAFDQETRRTRSNGEKRCSTRVAATGPIGLVELTGTGNRQHTLRVVLPGAELVLIAVDVENLMQGRGLRPWAEDLEMVRAAAEPLVDGPLVVLGDFNAVREHQPMRALLELGLADVAEASGAGWVRTFPASGPLLAIDHVLVGTGVEGRTLRAVDVAGSDHLALIATLSPRR